jgi:hypothetical protein
MLLEAGENKGRSIKRLEIEFQLRVIVPDGLPSECKRKFG